MDIQEKNIFLTKLSLIILIAGIFGGILSFLIDNGIGIIFIGLSLIFSLILGIISWKEKLSKITVIISSVIITLSILISAIMFFYSKLQNEIIEKEALEQSHKEYELQKNELFEYFQNIEVQYETEAQKESIIIALNDIINLPEEKLKSKKYPNYAGEENQWDLPTLINKYFVPTSKNIKLGENFYTEIKITKNQNLIKKIISDIQKDKKFTGIIVENKVLFSTYFDFGKEYKSVVFVLTVTNLSDTLLIPVLSNENVFKYSKFIINNKEVTNPVSMGGVELNKKNRMISYNDKDIFSWSTTSDYLKKEYGNIFTVQWKYMSTYSDVLEVNLENKTAVVMDR